MASSSDNPWLRFGTSNPGALDDFLRRLDLDEYAPAGGTHPTVLRFLDSFDWRLYRRGWALLYRDEVLQLLDRRSGGLLAERAVANLPVPAFAWDLERCPLRQRLEPVLSVRALLLIVTLRGSTRMYELEHPKTGHLWRMEHRSLRLARRGREQPFLEVVRLRSTGDQRKGRGWWTRTARKAGLSPLPPTLLEPALSCAGIEPATYSSRIRAALDPGQLALEAGFVLAQGLLSTLMANVAGVRQDIDTEFLHDFRVAVRRTRSLLGLMRKIFPSEVVVAARADFARLGRATNPLRDLDVALLRYGEYRDLLPESLHEGLLEIFAQLRDRRAAVRRELDAALAGPETTAILARWEEFLADPAAARERAPEAATRPIGPAARRLLAREAAKVLAHGERMLAAEGPAEIHALRIRCKRLRYALEFFASLLPGKQAAALVGQLKKLQDELGRFNDLTLQLADLRTIAQRRSPRPSAQASAAAGALILLLGEQRDALRGPIVERYRAFADCDALKALR